MLNSIFKKLLVLSSIFLLLAIGACSSDDKVEEPKSIEQIQADEGIPVVVQKITPAEFSKGIKFFAKLRGVKETTEGAKIGGRVEKINKKVGDFVKEGEVIVEFPIDAPGSMYEQTKVAYENSLKNYERAKALLNAGETSQANFDGLEAKYLVDKSNYDTQRQMIFIEAPYAGVITEFMVNEKDNVSSKDPLFSIAQLNKLTAKIWANSEEIKSIKKGTRAILVDDGEITEGKVSEISIKADPRTQAFYADIEFPNPKLKLKTGTTEEIQVVVYEKTNAISIPRNLIEKDNDGKFIYVMENNAAVKKYISTGLESDLNVEVVEGLSEGEMLITKGSSRLTNGSKLKVIQ